MGRRKGSRNWGGVRRLEIIAELAANSAATYSEISEKFGVSRERIRQIAAEELPDTGKIRIARRRIAKQRAVPPWFRTRITDWLLEYGYAYCCHCHRVLDLEQMARTGNRRPCKCLECVSATTKAYYHTPHGREHVAQYQRSERGRVVNAAAQKRFYAKKLNGKIPMTKSEVCRLMTVAKARKREERAMEREGSDHGDTRD